MKSNKVKKRGRNKHRRLRLKRQISDPIKPSSLYGDDYGAQADDDHDVLCTIDSPEDNEIVLSKKKVKMRRKRSNSFTVESPSKLKLHAFNFKKSGSYVE